MRNISVIEIAIIVVASKYRAGTLNAGVIHCSRSLVAITCNAGCCSVRMHNAGQNGGRSRGVVARHVTPQIYPHDMIDVLGAASGSHRAGEHPFTAFVFRDVRFDVRH